MPSFPLGPKGRPTLPVRLRHKGNITNSIDALVDTGADITVFDAMFLEQLGLKLKAGVASGFSGLGGDVDGYWHKVSLDAELTPKPTPADVLFVEGLADQTDQLGILGVGGFLQHFRFTLDIKAGGFDLE